MNRRHFLMSTAVMAGGAAVRGLASPNDTVRIGVVGCGGRGSSHVAAWPELHNVEIVALCDVDESHIAEKLKTLESKGLKKPATYVDFRKLLEDKSIDAVSLATPNHWHTLQTIWACQAGKDVYVEKPCSHNVFESQQIVAAARKHNRIVQQGSQSRSSPALQEGVERLKSGEFGEVYMARGLCYKWRDGIGKYPDGPMAPGEKFALTYGSTSYEPTYDTQYLSKVDYDLWLGPAPKRAFNRNRFHYNWHWHWDYGNGDTGNQGPHQFDIARWGLGKNEHPVKVSSMGGYFGGEASQETPDMQTAMFEYADGAIMEFGTRGEHTNDEGSVRIGNIFYGTKGWLWIEESGRKWQSYMGSVGAKNEKGPGSSTPASPNEEPTGLTTTEFPHYQNFVDAIRA